MVIPNGVYTQVMEFVVDDSIISNVLVEILLEHAKGSVVALRVVAARCSARLSTGRS